MEAPMFFRLSIVFILAAFISGCGSEINTSCNGEERCSCYGDNTCNEGLVCLSDICVKPEDGDMDTPDGDTSETETTDGDLEEIVTDGDLDTIDGDSIDNDTPTDGDLTEDVVPDGDTTEGDRDVIPGSCDEGCNLAEGYYCDTDKNQCVLLLCQACLTDDDCTWPSMCREHETAEGYKICQGDTSRESCKPGYMPEGGWCVPVPKCGNVFAIMGDKCHNPNVPDSYQYNDCFPGMICLQSSDIDLTRTKCTVACEPDNENYDEVCESEYSQGCCKLHTFPENKYYCYSYLGCN